MRASRPSASAEMVALSRSLLHSVGVIDDPWAVTFLGRRRRMLARAFHTRPLSRSTTGPTFSFLAARTRFFDQLVLDAFEAGCTQAVIVGAGYDTRAWRLARPGVRFFEVDHPATQRRKQRLAAPGRVTFVPVDLRSDPLDDVLSTAGLATDRTSVFLLEGLTMYLTADVTRTVLSALAKVAAPGSRLVALFSASGGGSGTGPSGAIAAIVRASWRLAGEPTYQWAGTDVTRAMLPSTGWRIVSEHGAPELVERFLAGTDMAVTGSNPDLYCVVAERSPQAHR